MNPDEEELDLSVYSSETVEIEMDGQIYRGIRFITGADELRHTVHFGGLRQIDPKPHRATWTGCGAWRG